MKVPAAALVALLLVATCSPSRAHLDGVPTACCFSYQQRPVPRALMASAWPSTQHGFSPGSLVTKKKKKELCADPRAPWVQAHLKHFQTLKN
ncbi:PREDICTED: C-C motif chemokine 3-like [Charadrius vociferus]|uniref:C-C motif chemokine 3-like n=1 Tax=Charadrius vociferus TaxID=50402 RepID=UPI0005212F75|nr:PREDICTED: C-C motif chemokine 3-like [Charadrius vociferus]